GREVALRRSLERVLQHYELVVLDCPPGLSLLGINAILAADGLIVPVSAEPMAADALDATLASIDRVPVRLHGAGRLVGILLTQIDPRRSVTRETGERLRAAYRDRVFHTELRWTAALAAAPAAQHPPPAADDFKRLGGEVLQRLAAIKHDRPR